jgi:sugar phosphate isomerase/epimerase
VRKRQDVRDSLTAPSRRSFIQLGASALSAAFVTGPALAARKPRKIPIALQLWSVRDDLAKDFDGTLKAIADMGFEGVEFAGYHSYKDDAQGLRKKLDALKLKAAGTHIGTNAYATDALAKTVEFHKTIGCRFLIAPGDKRFTDPQKSVEYAKALSDGAAALKPHGLFCGHHNHTGEFEKAPDGKTYWDLFAERTSKDVILQQDFGWTTVAGLDPVALVKRYPGRTRTGHFKAKLPKNAAPDRKPFIGEDTIDWKALIEACDTVGGTEWFVVEQEDYPDGMAPLACVKRSYDGLRKILASMGR